MSNIEKLYYNMNKLNDNYKDTEETQEAQEAMEAILESAMSREAYLECEEAIYKCMSANEKQGFITGFQYAVSLLTSGKAVDALCRG